MQLKDYFKAQKDINLNQNEKFFLYEKIISQKDKKTFARTKYFVNIKSFAYWFAMIILLIGVYGVYFFNWDFSYEWFMVTNTLNQVNADYIAKVVDFNWDFYIKHWGKYYKTSNISNWDNVILKKWSEIIFDIDSSTKAKIIWPARFTLDKTENNYKLLLSQGDFIQIESIDQKQNSMEVILKDLKISSNQNMNFQIKKENDQYSINNQWEEIVVTQPNDTRELQNKQLLTIKEDETTIIENIEDFWKAITQNNVGQTFAITNDTDTAQEEITQNLLNNINPEDSEITNTKLAENLWIIDDKKIPTAEQSKTIHSLLNNNFVMWNIKWIFKSYISWDDKDYSYNIWLLTSRIQKIYNLFDIKYTNENDLSSNIQQLTSELTNNYHIPSKYTDNLVIITKRVDYIKQNTYWSNTNIEQIDQLWNDLETNTPAYLILK